jgi:vitamin B12 transporter
MKHIFTHPLAILVACTGFGSAYAADSPLEEIVISASRIPSSWSQVAPSITKLDQADLNAFGNTALVDILQYQPSVSVSHTGGVGKAATVRIRGEEGYRTLVLLDGIPLTDTSGTQHGPRLEHLLSQGLTSVEILRGPQALLYGADAGGVINLSTRPKSEGWQSSVLFETGRYGHQTISLGSSMGSETGFIALSHQDLSTDGFNASASDTDTRDKDGYDNVTTHLSGELRILDHISSSFSYRETAGENEYDGCYNTSFSLVNDCRDSYDMQVSGIGFTLDALGSEHQLQLSRTETQKAFYSEAQFSFGAEGRLDRVSYLGHSKINDHGTLIWGADHEQSELDDGSFLRSRDQVGVFSEFQWSPTDSMFTAVALRYDDNDDFGTHTSMRATLVKLSRVGHAILKYKLSAGTGFRAPSLYEIAYNAGPFAYGAAATDALGEEQSRGLDLGLEWIHDDGTHLQATLFQQTVSDEIFFDLQSYSGYLQDEGDASVSGLELVASKPISTHFTLQANATFMDSERPDGSDRIYRPNEEAALSLTFVKPGNALSGHASVLYRGSAKDIDGSDIDGFTTLNLKLSWRLEKNLLAHIRIENALDADRREIPGYFAPRASFFSGLTLNF